MVACFVPTNRQHCLIMGEICSAVKLIGALVVFYHSGFVICVLFLFSDLQSAAEVELKQPREASEIVEGADVSLKCSADGNPEPNVVFFKNKVR